jgi:YesN/AraC family two-component response regulator
MKLQKETKLLDVLYVEDDIALRENSAILLNRLFKSVTLAENGVVALEKYQENSFDLVLTDINMPLMDGLELSRKIRAKNPHQIITVFTAYNEHEYLLEMIHLNIDGFIFKPFDIEQFNSTLYRIAHHCNNQKCAEQALR